MSRLTTIVALMTFVPLPVPAAAQWYVAATLGASAAPPSTVTIDQPARGRHLELDPVEWASQSLASPPYYGYRVGRLFGARRRLGVEAEFVHAKAFADTSRTVRIRGVENGATLVARARMDTRVTRYAMSHGLNLILGNVVWRRLVGAGDGSVSLTTRVGAGLVVPHAETTMDGASVDRYELGGMAVQGSAGADVRLRGRLSVLVEYKLACARPEIAVADGTGRTALLVHQIAAGVAFGFAR